MKNDSYKTESVILAPFGGGRYEYIGLIIKEALYETLSSTPFIIPADPGP